MNYEKVGNELYVIPENMSCNKESYNYKILSEENLEYYNRLIGTTEKFYKFSQIGETLAERVVKKPLKSGDLVNIITSIDNMLSETKNYLLPEGNIVLDLYSVSVFDGKYSFTMLPESVGDFNFELSKFLIRLLRYIDHNDQQGLELAFQLFVKSSKDNYTMNDLIEVCENIKNKESK